MIKYRLDMIINKAEKVSENTGDLDYLTDEEIKNYMKEIINLAKECKQKIDSADAKLVNARDILV